MTITQETQIEFCLAGQESCYVTNALYAEWGRGDVFRMMLKRLGISSIEHPGLTIKKIVIERENGWLSASAHNEPYHCTTLSEVTISPTELLEEFPRLKGRL